VEIILFPKDKMEDVCACGNKVQPRHHGLVKGSGDAAVAICGNCLKAAGSDKQAELKSEVAEGSSSCEGCGMVISKGRLVIPACDIIVKKEKVHVDAIYSYPSKEWCSVCSSIADGHAKCYACLSKK
jgi:hypothetical protein